ncbi:HAD-IIIC family phosphatase [Chengkuizengella sp. SCS-71B]|uniref:HAD-IIIC family phosphatase n=1 Tax=Chengkuizengella sp. SCS-71B TaxID=3115290 RepID=UPI0032C226D5
MLDLNLLESSEVQHDKGIEEVSLKDIAIIGVSANLPLSPDQDKFWEHLISGVDCVRNFPTNRLEDVLPLIDSNDIEFYPGAYLDEIDKFDYKFFGISPKEASLMNPNQRLFLQTAWKTIEDAGYGGDKLKGSKTGVYVGYNADAFTDYKKLIAKSEPDSLSMAIPGNLTSIIASRISYLLDFKGPALCIDTACSSSLVAVHIACKAIQNGDCDQALVGSVNVNILPFDKNIKIGIESSDGRARTFDQQSDGTGSGEGSIAILLKPLSRAQHDRDHIYAVIKGSSINQDGSSIGITAPNVSAQEEVIVKALQDADIHPETIGYIEAHGTGTKLGDPIEIEGITKAYQRYTNKKQFCAIGAVKTNIGHLDNAAGIAGLLKTVLTLQHALIPPLLHFQESNSQIDFISSPVFINKAPRKWDKMEYPRRAGVSSFGMSGTNCHVILEEAQLHSKDNVMDEQTDFSDLNIFTISAKSKTSLERLIDQYKKFFNKQKHVNVNDLCYTVNTGRGHYDYRIAMLVKDVEDLKIKLNILEQLNEDKFEMNQIYYSEFISNECDLENHEHMYSTKPSEKELTKICLDYTQGSDINWNHLYGDHHKKISLPTYCFDNTRCWLDLSLANQTLSNEVKLLGRKSGNYSEIEQMVAQIWGEILGFKELQIQAPFYELGGDSILALKIVNQISERSQMAINVTDLLQNETIEQLAEFIHHLSQSQSDANNDMTEITQTELRESYPLSSAQQRMYILHQIEGASLSYNMPLAMFIKGKLDEQRFEDCFQLLIQRHESLRTSFGKKDEQLIQKIHDDVNFKILFNKINKEDIPSTIKAFVQPFDISSAPLFRAGVFHINDEEHLFILDMHHIISDGASMNILVKDFILLYEGASLHNLKLQYRDYAVWQNEWLNSEQFQIMENYWMNKLSGELPTLQMPLDFDRPDQRTFDGESVHFEISKDRILNLTQFTKDHHVTLNILLFTLYSILLNKYTTQEEMIIGSLVLGRNHPDLESVIGNFINFIPIHTEVQKNSSILQFINIQKENMLEDYKHQNYPFEELVSKLKKQTERSRNVLYDTMLVFHNHIDPNILFETKEMKATRYDLDLQTSTLDLKLDIFKGKDHYDGYLEYNSNLFKRETIDLFIKHFLQLIDIYLANPNQKISDIHLFTDEEETQIEYKRTIVEEKIKTLEVAVTATFTSEPIEDYITYWAKQKDQKIEVNFAPYNQAFQQMLNEDSLISKNRGFNVLLVRFEDWLRDDHDDDEKRCHKLDQLYEQFSSTLRNKLKEVPYLVGIFPVSTHLNLSHKLTNHIQKLNEKWETELNKMSQVHLIDFKNMDVHYGVDQIFDPVTDKKGHLPFTEEYFAAVGTQITRKMLAKSNKYKVIVLDCDNTLWHGVCGEDGVHGIRINEPFQELQKFMLSKKEEGFLLAISSKNNEEDVWEVFDKNPAMILKKEHFVHWKINWNSKSENIKQIAKDLNLGLDSFIFVDDSPFEIEEVSTRCPEVYSLQLPEITKEIPFLLYHTWTFDTFQITQEDKKRTEMYLNEKERKNLQQTILSEEDFLDSLQLKMNLREIQKTDLERASQLTKRTNQFNLTTIRRSEEEITEMAKTDGVNCWVVEVSDRFGDYGTVGFLVTHIKGSTLLIETFLLSCRVLGRGIEHAVMSALKPFCYENNIKTLEAAYKPTLKNKPILEYLQQSDWQIMNEKGQSHQFSLKVSNLPDSIEYIKLVLQ